MNTNVQFFLAYLKVDLQTFCRNKTAAFWSFAFPLLLLVIFMASFGNAGGLAGVAMRIEDRDNSAVSADFIAYTRFVFGQQRSLEVRFDGDAAETLTLVIPAGFRDKLEAHQGVLLRLSGAAPNSLSSDIAGKILASVADDFVLRKLYDYRGIAIVPEAPALAVAPPASHNYPAYLVTGLLCMVVISTALMGFVTPLVNSRQLGHFRVFELVPASRGAVVLALATSKFIVILASGLLLFAFGAGVYKLGLPGDAGAYARGLLVLVTGVLGFLALALVVAARVRTTDWANIICNLIYFPLILLGNLFIPVESGRGLAKALDYMPVNLFVKALRGTLLNGEALSAHAFFFGGFALIIVFSLAYSSRAFVLSRGVA